MAAQYGTWWVLKVKLCVESVEPSRKGSVKTGFWLAPWGWGISRSHRHLLDHCKEGQLKDTVGSGLKREEVVECCMLRRRSLCLEVYRAHMVGKKYDCIYTPIT